MKKLLIAIIVMVPILVEAQQPKMYLKLFGGVNATTLVYKIEDVDNDVLAGWQAGGGFRIHHRKVFGEIDFVYFKQGITFSPREDDELSIEEDINVHLRGFEIPMTLGYVPVKKPLYGCFLYGGIVNWFSMKGSLEYQGEEIIFKPKEVHLHFYNLGARFGVQIDVAMFNFDFSYTIGITNHFREKARTNSHSLCLNAGLLF